jgi:hypothetical protein
VQRRPNSRIRPLGERVACLEGKMDILVALNVAELAAILGLIGIVLIHII